ncbi:MAG: hypothetical protein A4S09_07540 [Proteobacteria bacterium SG_bin7]|nr:MAG: hypothetical protein A4S09_07540 [Proteobacteria bacterium SG_bin7]
MKIAICTFLFISLSEVSNAALYHYSCHLYDTNTKTIDYREVLSIDVGENYLYLRQNDHNRTQIPYHRKDTGFENFLVYRIVNQVGPSNRVLIKDMLLDPALPFGGKPLDTFDSGGLMKTLRLNGVEKSHICRRRTNVDF